MVNVEKYIGDLIGSLKLHFKSRLIYVGLQGSYLRGEANPESDIDIMLVLDELRIDDLKDYRSIISRMDHFDKSCGFICGKAELANWNPLEMCHLLHTTRDYYGCLQDLVPVYTEADICNFIKMSINNLYHEICHRFIHADEQTNINLLPGSYKSVFFVLQNLHYLNSGEFINSKAQLLDVLDGSDKAVLERSLAFSKGDKFELSDSFDLLFKWCRDKINTI